MRRRVEAGHIRERGTEWDAVRTLLAHDTQTAMGRERAAAAEPLTDAVAVQAEIELTREARLALAQAGAPPLAGPPDVRPLLDRARAAGSILHRSEEDT